MRLWLNRDLNVEASHVDMWGKSLPGRGINKGNGPGKSVKSDSCDWQGWWEIQGRGSWKSDHRGPLN